MIRTCINAPEGANRDRLVDRAPGRVATTATATQNGTTPMRRRALGCRKNPLHRFSAEQIEQIGKEFDALHEQVKADLGDRDATYIRR